MIRIACRSTISIFLLALLPSVAGAQVTAVKPGLPTSSRLPLDSAGFLKRSKTRSSCSPCTSRAISPGAIGSTSQISFV